MEQNQQQQGFTPEELVARADYFLKKKNLYHVKEDLLQKQAQLEASMQEQGVTPQDIAMNRMPDDIREKVEAVVKAGVRLRGTTGFALKKAVENKEIGEAFEEEFKHGHEIEQQRQLIDSKEDIKAYNEAETQEEKTEALSNSLKARGLGVDKMFTNLQGGLPSFKETMKNAHKIMKNREVERATAKARERQEHLREHPEDAEILQQHEKGLRNNPEYRNMQKQIEAELEKENVE